MEIARTVEEARRIARDWKKQGLEIGLVPTMGYLHEGHGSLMAAARKENARVAASIFVNPTQFGPNEDLARYPRDFERDRALCEKMGVDMIFHPEPEDMYRSAQAFVDIGLLADTLDGAARPGHFRGVCTVVSKLFNIIQPDRAYFGEKDAQQLAIIRKMAFDLNFDVQVVGCPIVREADGLAKSSRNTYLNAAERAAAPVLYRAIEHGKSIIKKGMPAQTLISEMEKVLAAEPLAKTEYVAVVDAMTMQPVDVIDGAVLIPMAVRVGGTRLIDNFSLTPER